MIALNGEGSDLRAGETVAAALRSMGLELDVAGVAVAVDGQVVPRGQWRSFELGEHARVEVLTAMQGG
jgi:sulfur carrier protein